MSDIDKILEDLDKLVNAQTKEAIEDLQNQIEQAIKETEKNLIEENGDNETENKKEAL